MKESLSLLLLYYFAAMIKVLLKSFRAIFFLKIFESFEHYKLHNQCQVKKSVTTRSLKLKISLFLF